jgi:hypothetical protein
MEFMGGRKSSEWNLYVKNNYKRVSVNNVESPMSVLSKEYRLLHRVEPRTSGYCKGLKEDECLSNEKCGYVVPTKALSSGLIRRPYCYTKNKRSSYGYINSMPTKSTNPIKSLKELNPIKDLKSSNTKVINLRKGEEHIEDEESLEDEYVKDKLLDVGLDVNRMVKKRIRMGDNCLKYKKQGECLKEEECVWDMRMSKCYDPRRVTSYVKM